MCLIGYIKCVSEHFVVFLYQQNSALWRASESGDLAKVQECVNRGAYPNWVNPFNYVSPLLSIVSSFVLRLSHVQAGNDCSDDVSSSYKYT